MLNREECDNALTRLLRPYFAKVDVQNVYHDINRGHSIDEDSNLLTLLIMEHFSNPPLKFDELNKGYPIYDNDEIVCGWKFIYMIDKEYKQLLLIDEEGNVDWVNYEENRFYRKEVQNERRIFKRSR